MLALEFTLYRFVCDAKTFAGMFAEDESGRSIPETASFFCCWTSVSRSTHSRTNPSLLKPIGSSKKAFFKFQGSDMALTFHSTQVEMQLDGDKDVLMFQIKPSSYIGGDIPVVARGTLDPVPFFGKPRKNYSIKLRDAVGHVIGKLLFSLEAKEIEGDPATEVANLIGEKTGEGNYCLPSNSSSPASTNRSRSSSYPRKSHGREGSDRRPPSRHVPEGSHIDPYKVSTGLSKGLPRGRSPPRHSNPRAQSPDLSRRNRLPDAYSSSPLPQKPPADTSRLPTNLKGGEEVGATGLQLTKLQMSIERVGIKAEAICLDSPAPLVLGGEYVLRVRYHSQSFYTDSTTCNNPRELVYMKQCTAFNLLPQGREKLRFSLWENGKQVAGFSLDPTKFSLEKGMWKEYAIPFRYLPTQQASSLDVSVRILQFSSEGQSTGQQPLVSTSANFDEDRERHSSRTFPMREQHTQSHLARSSLQDSSLTAAQRLGSQGLRNGTPLRDPNGHHVQRSSSTTSLLRQREVAGKAIFPDTASDGGHSLYDYPNTGDSVMMPNTRRVPTPGLEVPILTRAREPSTGHALGIPSTPKESEGGSGCITPNRSLLSGNSPRSQRFLEAYQRGAAPKTSSLNNSGLFSHGTDVRNGTPVRQKQYSGGQDSRSPQCDDQGHETYMAEVMARLYHQSQAPRQRSSLMEEWLGWRERKSSTLEQSGIFGRSPSVASRDDSVASIVSRRALTPLPTKSFAGVPILCPFSEESVTKPRRRASVITRDSRSPYGAAL